MERTLDITATDGFRLAATLVGDGQARSLIVVNAATGVPQTFYRRFADFLASRGHQVLTWDYRGQGRSRPRSLRGFEARFRDWGYRDLEGVLRFAEREARGRPVDVVGHSIGGQVLGFPEHNGVIRRAVTVAACSGAWHLYPGADKLGIAAIWYAMPLLARPLGFLPGVLGTGADLPRGIADEWSAWGRSENYFLDHGVDAAGFLRLTGPLRSYSFTDDRYAPRAAVEWLHGLFRRAHLERFHVDPSRLGLEAIGHFGFFRPALRESLWREVDDFFG